MTRRSPTENGSVERRSKVQSLQTKHSRTEYTVRRVPRAGGDEGDPATARREPSGARTLHTCTTFYTFLTSNTIYTSNTHRNTHRIHLFNLEYTSNTIYEFLFPEISLCDETPYISEVPIGLHMIMRIPQV